MSHSRGCKCTLLSANCIVLSTLQVRLCKRCCISSTCIIWGSCCSLESLIVLMFKLAYICSKVAVELLNILLLLVKVKSCVKDWFLDKINRSKSWFCPSISCTAWKDCWETSYIFVVVQYACSICDSRYSTMSFVCCSRREITISSSEWKARESNDNSVCCVISKINKIIDFWMLQVQNFLN